MCRITLIISLLMVVFIAYGCGESSEIEEKHEEEQEELELPNTKTFIWDGESVLVFPERMGGGSAVVPMRGYWTVLLEPAETTGLAEIITKDIHGKLASIDLTFDMDGDGEIDSVETGEITFGIEDVDTEATTGEVDLESGRFSFEMVVLPKAPLIESLGIEAFPSPIRVLDIGEMDIVVGTYTAIGLCSVNEGIFAGTMLASSKETPNEAELKQEALKALEEAKEEGGNGQIDMIIEDVRLAMGAEIIAAKEKDANWSLRWKSEAIKDKKSAIKKLETVIFVGGRNGELREAKKKLEDSLDLERKELLKGTVVDDPYRYDYDICTYLVGKYKAPEKSNLKYHITVVQGGYSPEGDFEEALKISSKIFKFVGEFLGGGVPGGDEYLKNLGKLIDSAPGAYHQTLRIWTLIEGEMFYEYKLLHRDDFGWDEIDSWFVSEEIRIIEKGEVIFRVRDQPLEMARRINDARERAEAAAEDKIEAMLE